jgi:hypothetical protein
MVVATAAKQIAIDGMQVVVAGGRTTSAPAGPVHGMGRP